MTHDPLDLTPQSEKDSAWHRLLIRLGLSRRNATDARQQKAASDNKPLRDAEAARKARQPGGGE